MGGTPSWPTQAETRAVMLMKEEVAETDARGAPSPTVTDTFETRTNRQLLALPPTRGRAFGESAQKLFKMEEYTDVASGWMRRPAGDSEGVRLPSNYNNGIVD